MGVRLERIGKYFSGTKFSLWISQLPYFRINSPASWKFQCKLNTWSF